MPATISSAVSNFMYRREAERVETEEPRDINDAPNADNNSLADEDGEEGQFVGRSSATSSRTVATGNEESSQRVPMLEGEATTDPSNRDNSTTGEASGTQTTRSSSRRRTFRGLTLRDLEEEREIVQRRTGGCVLVSSFILLRLWIQALMTGDFGLLILCLVFTSWTAKFVRYTRDREEELNRMINEWDENADEEPGVSDRNLARMSFQSQLALAIMQSQIQMMEGGYGHPDGGENKPGVDNEIRKKWNMFEFKSPSCHGDLFGSEGDCKSSGEEEPTCSICLGEYEKGEKLISLPCGHVFHEDCIKSWTEHNTRCPLCNADLTEVSGNEVV